MSHSVLDLGSTVSIVHVRRSLWTTACPALGVQAQEQSPYWVPPSAKPSPSLAQLPAGGSNFPGAKPCRLWRRRRWPTAHALCASLVAQSA